MNSSLTVESLLLTTNSNGESLTGNRGGSVVAWVGSKKADNCDSVVESNPSAKSSVRLAVIEISHHLLVVTINLITPLSMTRNIVIDQNIEFYALYLKFYCKSKFFL